MKFRAAHMALLVLALVPGLLGVTVIGRGFFDRSYDSTPWTYLAFGGPLLLVAVALAVFAVRDAARRTPGRPRE